MNKIIRGGVMLTLPLKTGFKRAEWTLKHRYFKAQGKNCYFNIVNFNTEPYLISFGDNVSVATGVKFITHDVTHFVFSNMEPTFNWKGRTGEIRVGSNVFIGANAIILYDVTIGDNVIIAAGAVVTNDIPSGTIYGGVPARKIGQFNEYMKKAKEHQFG